MMISAFIRLELNFQTKVIVKTVFFSIIFTAVPLISSMREFVGGGIKHRSGFSPQISKFKNSFLGLLVAREKVKKLILWVRGCDISNSFSKQL